MGWTGVTTGTRRTYTWPYKAPCKAQESASKPWRTACQSYEAWRDFRAELQEVQVDLWDPHRALQGHVHFLQVPTLTLAHPTGMCRRLGKV